MFVDGALFETTDVPMTRLDGLDPGSAYFVEVVPFDADGNRLDCVPGAMVMTDG